jgi:hypothetical protein
MLEVGGIAEMTIRRHYQRFVPQAVMQHTRTKLLVSYRINRQLSVWNPHPLVFRAFGAHCHKPTFL